MSSSSYREAKLPPNPVPWPCPTAAPSYIPCHQVSLMSASCLSPYLALCSLRLPSRKTLAPPMHPHPCNKFAWTRVAKGGSQLTQMPSIRMTNLAFVDLIKGFRSGDIFSLVEYLSEMEDMIIWQKQFFSNLNLFNAFCSFRKSKYM